MVSVDHNDGEVRLILRPNCSMSWRGNKYLFLGILIWLGTFSIALAAMGAWVVLFFVGLELLALGGALYYVSWKLSHCEVLHISGDQVTIAKGAKQLKSSWTLSRAEVTVQVAAARHPWGTPTIQFVCKSPTVIRVGEFLNQQDCKQLLQLLVSARLQTRHSEGRVTMVF